MTAKTASDLQKHTNANAHNVQVEYYGANARLLHSVAAIDLDDMLQSWLVQLKGQRKSPNTMRNYTKAVRQYLKFCDDNELPRELNKSILVAFMAAWPGEASTAVLTLRELKIFARWLADEEGLDPSGVLSVKPPKADQPVVADMPADDIKAMMRVCDGSSLRDRRDKALLGLFSDTGMRASEMVALEVADVDVIECSVIVRRGKGGKGRRSQFSAATAAHVDRYMRSRKQAGHNPRQGALWVGTRGETIGYAGIVQTLKKRAAEAGVDGFHLHRMRHSMAVNWMSGGGSQITLMAQAGWSSPTMIGRYVKAANERLAAEEFKRLGLSIVD
jgi:integrase/recombinase XerD